MTRRNANERRLFSRRTLLKSFGWAPVLLRPAPFFAALRPLPHPAAFDFADSRFVPHYPLESPLADVMKRVAPGSDEYITEKYATEIEALFGRWASDLIQSPQNQTRLGELLDSSLHATPLDSAQPHKIRSSFGVDVERHTFPAAGRLNRDSFVQGVSKWLGGISRVRNAEFEIYQIEMIASNPLSARISMRYDLVLEDPSQSVEERIGTWRIECSQLAPQAWKVQRWEADQESRGILHGPAFVDITEHALGGNDSYAKQLLRGSDYWRTVLDGAAGFDVYCNNGVAAGDFDNDGLDDLYVCQPAGLPNRLYRNRGDGTFEDLTEKSGVGILDNSACALFADFRNSGLQDLLVLCGTGPLLFENRGDGNFALKKDAFHFAQPPQGTFTHAAAADYDGDGRLDLYLCTYQYYLGLDQYHYPIPYYDARNGPPNCLFHNEGDLKFVEATAASGMNIENNRYSFACAWGDANADGRPDLFVVNDFGSSQLYRNEGNGLFSHVSAEAHVEDVGAGMSCCWCDFDNDGNQDVYVPSMWEAAGQRVSEEPQFHAQAPASIRGLYQRHARGNALYRNRADGTFENIGDQARVEMGRWSWCSDFFDFDHDGFSDLYVANGYLSGADHEDLAGFFWRQVVAKSSEDASPSSTYEHGWNAINELVRSDYTWHGYARNVFFANNHDATFTEMSGPSGLDLLEDSRSFALADIDHDGRLEIILKNRNAPQVRILRNNLEGIGRSVSFRLRGVKSNRDAIGAAVTVEAGSARQTKYVQAGTGFLAQNSKELFFGVAGASSINVSVRWPSGTVQQFSALPVDHRIEIVEGESKFAAIPFQPAAMPLQAAIASPHPEQLPAQVETWLVDPLRAPEFILPDLSRVERSIKSFEGSPLLLSFWSAAATESVALLELLHESRTPHLSLLAVNVDQDPTAARSLAMRKGFTFPVVCADETVAGVYNLVYRHLFDRRRNLPFPTSFLIDASGSIVKVYQGLFEPHQLVTDIQNIPRSPQECLAKALPFKGQFLHPSPQRNIFTFGVAFYQNGFLDHAAETFRQVIAARPGDADAYYNLGTLSLRRKDYDQARAALEKTVELRPEYPEAWNNLGMLSAQSGQPDAAVQAFQRSLQLRPNYAIALVNLGNLYRTQHAFDKAEECLNRALHLEPKDAEVNYSMGMLYAQQGQAQPAMQYLQAALTLRPTYPEALNNLGVLFVRQQDYARAEQQFTEGIRVAPGFDQSYLNLARLYAIENRSDQARTVLLDLLKVQPANTAAQKALNMLK